MQVDEITYQKLLQTVQQQQNYIIRLKDKYDIIFDQNYLKNKVIEELQQQIHFLKHQLNSRSDGEGIHKQQKCQPAEDKQTNLQVDQQQLQGIKIQIQELYEQICELKKEKQLIASESQRKHHDVVLQYEQANAIQKKQIEQIKEQHQKIVQNHKKQYKKLSDNYNFFLKKFGVLLSLLQQQQLYIDKQSQEISKKDQKIDEYQNIFRKWIQISEFLNDHLSTLHKSIYKCQNYSSALYNFNLILEQQIKDLKLQLDRYSQQLINNQDTFLTQKQIIRYFYNYYQNTAQLFDRYRDHIDHLNKQAKINQGFHEHWVVKYEGLINKIQDQNDKNMMEQWNLLQQYVGQRQIIKKQNQKITNLQEKLTGYDDEELYNQQVLIQDLQQQLLDKDQLIQQQTDANQMQDAIIDEMQSKIDSLVAYQRSTMATISNLEYNNNMYQNQLAQLQQQYNEQIQELRDAQFNQRFQKEHPEELDEGEGAEFKEPLFEKQPKAILYHQNQQNSDTNLSNIPVINVINNVPNSHRTTQDMSQDSRYESLLNKLDQIKQKTYNVEQRPDENSIDIISHHSTSNKSLSFIYAQREQNLQQLRNIKQYQTASDLTNSNSEISAEIASSQIIAKHPQVNVSLNVEFQSKNDPDPFQAQNQAVGQNFSFLTQNIDSDKQISNLEKPQNDISNKEVIQTNVPTKPKPFKLQDKYTMVQPFGNEIYESQILDNNNIQNQSINAFTKPNASQDEHTPKKRTLQSLNTNPFSDMSSIQDVSQLDTTDNKGKPKIHVESFLSDLALNESQVNI